MRSNFLCPLLLLALLSSPAAPATTDKPYPTIEINVVNWSGKTVDAKAQMKCMKGPSKTRLDSSPRYSSNHIVMQWFIDPSPECRNSQRSLSVNIAGMENHWVASNDINPPDWIYTIQGKSEHPALHFIKYFLRNLAPADELDLQLDL